MVYQNGQYKKIGKPATGNDLADCRLFFLFIRGVILFFPGLLIAWMYVISHFTKNNLHLLFSPDHIKKIGWVVLLVSAALLLYFYFNPLLMKKPFPPDHLSITEEQYGQVQVLKYGSNRIGDIDKFFFDKKGQQAWLHFPPHTAKFVMHAAPENAMVDIVFNASGKKAADGKTIHELLSVKSTTASFAVHDLPPPLPASGKPVELSGKIAAYQLDEKGVVAGFVLDRYIIEIPKHVGQDIVPMLKKATIVTVKGYERNNGDGFINTSGLSLVKPSAIVIGETNYLL